MSFIPQACLAARLLLCVTSFCSLVAPLIRSDADDSDSFQSAERVSTNAHNVRHWLWIDADITVPTI